MKPTPLIGAVSSPAHDDPPGDILRDLISGFFNAAAQRDLARAQTLLDRLFRVRGRLPSLVALRRIAAGERTVARSGPVFYFEDSAITPAMLSDFDAAVAHATAVLGIPAPVVLLDSQAGLSNLHLTTENFPGFAAITLFAPAGGPGVDRSTIFHETGHAFLNCGVRLLDEGLACVIESGAAVASPAPAHAKVAFSLRTLLSRAANDGLFFEGTGAALEDAAAIRRLGARIVTRVRERRGNAGLAGLFYQLAQTASDTEVFALVEAALAMPLDEFMPPDGAQNGGAHIDAGYLDAILAAYTHHVPEKLDATIAALENSWNAAQPGSLDLLIRARLCRAELQLNTGRRVEPDDIARIDMLLLETGGLPEARALALRGHRAVLAVRLDGKNIVKVAINGEKAMKAYDRALRLAPDDPDVLVARAHLYINTPHQYGGDRARGLTMLHGLLGHPVYGTRVHSLLAYLGALPRTHEQAVTPQPSSERAPAIHVRQLQLRVSEQFALDIDELTIRRHERIAFVGRNGSGKSTLLEALLGLRKVTPGSVDVHLAGVADVASAMARKRRIGGLLQHVGLFGGMYVRELIRMHQVVYGRRSEPLLGLLGVHELLTSQYRTLSRGQMQRVQLYLAMGHEPEILLFDEPSLGLDEWFAQGLRDWWTQSGATIVVISHLAADIERMDRVVCMDDGKITEDGELAPLVRKYVGTVKAEILAPIDGATLARLAALPGIVVAPTSAHGRTLTYGTAALGDAFIKFVQANGIASFSVAQTGTEDFLSRFTKAK